jgi:hypothetical protein
MHHEAGVSARTIQHWLRHSDLETTLKYLAASDHKSEKTREQDPSQFFAVAVHEDGSFRFEYVPGNSEYTLKTHNVQDTEAAGSQVQMGQTVLVKKTVRNYGQVSQEVVVMDSDLDGVNVAVPVLP